MKLHKNKKLFQNYIALASQEEAIDESIVLKDYFVVLALKYLYKLNRDLVFIGGTSLSKCFNIIQRFSEDIDLVSIENSRKARQRSTYNIINNMVAYWPWNTETSNHKYSDFKELYLFYETNRDSLLEQRVKLELITFTDPFPVTNSRIEPVLNKYLDAKDKVHYEMMPVTVITQEPLRTFFEKITLEKELYKDNLYGLLSDESQETRARDFYDIHKIWLYYGKKISLNMTTFITMLSSRNKHRKMRTTINMDEYNQYKLREMFVKRNLRYQLENVDKRKLSIRDLDCDEIETSLGEIDCYFEELLE